MCGADYTRDGVVSVGKGNARSTRAMRSASTCARIEEGLARATNATPISQRHAAVHDTLELGEGEAHGEIPLGTIALGQVFDEERIREREDVRQISQADVHAVARLRR